MKDSENAIEITETVVSQDTTVDEVQSNRIIAFFDGEDSSKITLKEATISNLIVGPIALILYFALEYQYFMILRSHYYFHALLTFICFIIVPCSYLLIFQLKTGKAKYFFVATKKGLTPQKIGGSLLQGLIMHAGLFYPWVLLSQKYMPGVAELYYFLPDRINWFWQLFFVALNVMMFEFYSKAFIQLQFSEAQGSLNLFNNRIVIKGGKSLGFILQFLIWMGGHGQEFTWLPNFIGLANSIFFILVSGILTGITVYRTENIFGVTLGHILLNVFITITYAN